jgi:hypothetical protein
VAVYDQDFLAAISGHLVGDCLKQRQLQIAAVGDGTRLVAGLGDLAEVYGREYLRRGASKFVGKTEWLQSR